VTTIFGASVFGVYKHYRLLSNHEANEVKIAIVFVIIVGLAAAGWYAYEHPEMFASEEPAPQSQATVSAKKRYSKEEVRQAILSYLAQPLVVGPEFSAQTLGGAHLELLDLVDKQVYLSLPREFAEGNNRIASLKKFLLDDGAIRNADLESGLLSLDGHQLRQSPEKWALFETAIDNFAFKEETLLGFPYSSGKYTVSVAETMDFLTNRSIKGGLMGARVRSASGAGSAVVVNHGAMVTHPGEPSLQRFTESLLQSVPNGESVRERRVQRLLDFVTTEIVSESEPEADRSFLKRANEVLMTRSGTSGHKVILLASLLEQIHEPYLIVYMPRHVALAVPAGAYKTEDQLMTLTWKGTAWRIAETTALQFRIGLDHPKNDEPFRHLQYVQDPLDHNVITDLASGQPLEFL
jgi:hypothetical protein